MLYGALLPHHVTQHLLLQLTVSFDLLISSKSATLRTVPLHTDISSYMTKAAKLLQLTRALAE
jgi:hypothetical protein